MVVIWSINLKARNQSPSNHDHSYGPGVLPVICPFGGASHHMPLNFTKESNIEVKKLELEAKYDQNTAAILVLEAPHNVTHTDFVWFQLIIYDVSEATNRCTFDAK